MAGDAVAVAKSLVTRAEGLEEQSWLPHLATGSSVSSHSNSEQRYYGQKSGGVVS